MALAGRILALLKFDTGILAGCRTIQRGDMYEIEEWYLGMSEAAVAVSPLTKFAHSAPDFLVFCGNIFSFRESTLLLTRCLPCASSRGAL
jgi:hypothetical protein